MGRWRALPVILALVVVACASPPAPATPAASEAAPPTAVDAPTPTPLAPTATPLPTPSRPPTSTPSASPAATPTATPTPVPTATTPPTATPAARSPLTGLGLVQPERARWQPLAVQIDNDPAARPHSGLAAASIVVETPTEAGLTRFTAIYLDQDAAVVGPVRSARLVNLELTPEYQALLVSAGGAEGVLARINAAGLPHLNLLGRAGDEAAWRVASRPAPFNLFTSTERLRQAARGLGLERPTTLAAGAFGPLAALPAAAAAPAGLSLVIPYPHGAVRFVHDPASGGYRRLVDGQPHRDAADDTWLTPRNVVVQVTELTPTEIIEDTLGSRSLAARLRGQGPLLLLRDGKRLRGTWRRDRLAERTVYLDAAGRPLTLAPGQTWIALAPAGLVALDGD